MYNKYANTVSKRFLTKRLLYCHSSWWTYSPSLTAHNWMLPHPSKEESSPGRIVLSFLLHRTSPSLSSSLWLCSLHYNMLHVWAWSCSSWHSQCQGQDCWPQPPNYPTPVFWNVAIAALGWMRRNMAGLEEPIMTKVNNTEDTVPSKNFVKHIFECWIF